MNESPLYTSVSCDVVIDHGIYTDHLQTIKSLNHSVLSFLYDLECFYPSASQVLFQTTNQISQDIRTLTPERMVLINKYIESPLFSFNKQVNTLSLDEWLSGGIDIKIDNIFSCKVRKLGLDESLLEKLSENRSASITLISACKCRAFLVATSTAPRLKSQAYT